jgi:hypothetical protein
MATTISLTTADSGILRVAGHASGQGYVDVCMYKQGWVNLRLSCAAYLKLEA